MQADSAFINGKIVTMNGTRIVESVTIKYGKFLMVDSNEKVSQVIGKDTKVIDLEGKTVIPGLIDSHCHMMTVGASRKLNVDLSEEAGIHSINDLLDRLKEQAMQTPLGDWVLGYQEDDSKLAEKRHPTRWELDKASEKHPIIISTVGGHFSIANSKAFLLAGITKETADPIGGKFDRDKSGELIGGLHETAIGMILPEKVTIPTREQSYNGAMEILKECAEVGLTCVYDSVRKPQIRAALDLLNRNKLPIRVRMDIIIDLFPELNNLGIYRGLGNDWLRICGLKFFFDGAISARTAAVTEEYLNKPGFYGVMATTKEIASKKIFDAYREGYRISAHANGDRAIEMYLDILEEAQEKYPREDPRNRDIHCTVITPEIVERIKKLGILPTIFGPYVYYHGDKLIPAFGEERLERMFAAKSFLEAGVKIAAHSDHPCAPYPPLMAIHGLVNRKTKAGKPIGQKQKITVIDALKLYTTHSAYQQFDEDKLGSIEEGKLADMVVLGEDILEVSPDKIKDIPIEMTIVGGKIIYQRK